MALTLREAAKRSFNEGRVYESTIINQYAMSSPVLNALSFRDIPGGSLTYRRQETMPGVGFRKLNASYDESTGVINPQTETLAIAGGDLDVDKAQMKMMGDDIRETEELQKVESLALYWTNTFFNGDTNSAPDEFDGVKKRLTGTQLVDAGNTSGGDPLSLYTLDTLLSKVPGANAIAMNTTMGLRLTQAARNHGISSIQFMADDFGRQMPTYNGIPIMVVEQDNQANEILPFTEAAPAGGTAQCSSIYAFRFGELRLQGIQNGGIEVADLGELDSKPSMRTRVEWLCGIAMFHGRAAARLRGVTNDAVVA